MTNYTNSAFSPIVWILHIPVCAFPHSVMCTQCVLLNERTRACHHHTLDHPSPDVHSAQTISCPAIKPCDMFHPRLQSQPQNTEGSGSSET